MAKQTDHRVTKFEMDSEVDRRTNKKLAELGINKPEDLQPGRIDLIQAAEQLQGIDPQVDPLTAEKAMRDSQFAAMAEGAEQPTIIEDEAQVEAEQSPQPDRLTQLQAEAVAARAEADEWKQKYGERENRLGDERRKTAERLARLENPNAAGNRQTATETTQDFRHLQYGSGYDPRILGGGDPNEPMTRAESASLFQSMAAALGQQMTAREAQLLETTRQTRDYNVTPDEEISLIERHKWLANVDRSAQMVAMGDLVGSLRDQTKPSGGTPATPAMPQRQDMAALARARHITATTHIEPSTQGSPSELSASGEDNSLLAKKAARLRELLGTPGATDDPKLGPELERLMNETSGRRR